SGADAAAREFLWERAVSLFERRGYRIDEIRTVAALEHGKNVLPFALARLAALSTMRDSDAFRSLAALFTRVKNLRKGVSGGLGEERPLAELKARLREPAELALVDQLIDRWPALESALKHDRLPEAMQQLATLYPAVDRFFTEVLVMAEDQKL